VSGHAAKARVRAVDNRGRPFWELGEAAEQGDEADEALGGTNPRAASGAQPEVPPHAREVHDSRGHRFAAYPPCSADLALAIQCGEQARGTITK
jgi:hypothetical protein